MQEHSLSHPPEVTYLRNVLYLQVTYVAPVFTVSRFAKGEGGREQEEVLLPTLVLHVYGLLSSNNQIRLYHTISPPTLQ